MMSGPLPLSGSVSVLEMPTRKLQSYTADFFECTPCLLTFQTFCFSMYLCCVIQFLCQKRKKNTISHDNEMSPVTLLFLYLLAKNLQSSCGVIKISANMSLNAKSTLPIAKSTFSHDLIFVLSTYVLMFNFIICFSERAGGGRQEPATSVLPRPPNKRKPSKVPSSVTADIPFSSPLVHLWVFSQPGRKFSPFWVDGLSAPGYRK